MFAVKRIQQGHSISKQRFQHIFDFFLSDQLNWQAILHFYCEHEASDAVRMTQQGTYYAYHELNFLLNSINFIFQIRAQRHDQTCCVLATGAGELLWSVQLNGNPMTWNIINHTRKTISLTPSVRSWTMLRYLVVSLSVIFFKTGGLQEHKKSVPKNISFCSLSAFWSESQKQEKRD